MLIISIVSSNHSFEKYMNKPCTAILMGCVFARIYNVSKNEQQTIWIENSQECIWNRTEYLKVNIAGEEFNEMNTRLGRSVDDWSFFTCMGPRIHVETNNKIKHEKVVLLNVYIQNDLITS